jgi:hypothetical protein
MPTPRTSVESLGNKPKASPGWISAPENSPAAPTPPTSAGSRWIPFFPISPRPPSPGRIPMAMASPMPGKSCTSAISPPPPPAPIQTATEHLTSLNTTPEPSRRTLAHDSALFPTPTLLVSPWRTSASPVSLPATIAWNTIKTCSACGPIPLSAPSHRLAPSPRQISRL